MVAEPLAGAPSTLAVAFTMSALEVEAVAGLTTAVAMPLEFVTTVVLSKAPLPRLVEKETSVCGTTAPAVFLTSAVTVAGLSRVADDEERLISTEGDSLKIERETDPETERPDTAEVAVTVTTPVVVALATVPLTLATPLLLVTAVELLKLNSALLLEKLTICPAEGVPSSLRTVADKVVGVEE